MNKHEIQTVLNKISYKNWDIKLDVVPLAPTGWSDYGVQRSELYLIAVSYKAYDSDNKLVEFYAGRIDVSDCESDKQIVDAVWSSIEGLEISRAESLFKYNESTIRVSS